LSNKFPIKYLTVLFFVYLLTGCSPSTSTQRYNKPVSNTRQKESPVIRFTSNDETEHKSATAGKDVYRDPGNLPSKENLPVDPAITTTEFVKKYDKIKKLSRALTPREKVLFEIVHYLDTPYKYGGESRKGIDCSAFTQNVYQKSLGIKLPRTARQQYKIGRKVSRLKFGDLVYFDTQRGVFPGHVGIYLGDSLFAHASSSQGVTVSSLTAKYYKDHFVGANRINKTLGN